MNMKMKLGFRTFIDSDLQTFTNTLWELQMAGRIFNEVFQTGDNTESNGYSRGKDGKEGQVIRVYCNLHAKICAGHDLCSY